MIFCRCLKNLCIVQISRINIIFSFLLYSEKETHENNCTFRPFNCPFIECDEKLVASDVVDHVSYRIFIYFSCFSIENSDHVLEEIRCSAGFFLDFSGQKKAKSFDNVCRILITFLKKSVFSWVLTVRKVEMQMAFLTFLVKKSR